MRAYSGKPSSLLLVIFSALLTLVLVLPAAAQDTSLARIILPLRGETLRGSIAIQGSATSPQFARYQVIYAPEPALTDWVVINASDQPVPNGTLAVWNTRVIPDGKYAIKLQVFSNDGTAVEAVVRDITLANTTATPAVVTSTVNSSVTGTASLSGSTGSLLPSSLSNIKINVSDIPKAFLKGVTYTAYAFGALLAYLLLKKVVSFLLRRVLHKPIDYSR